MKSCLFNNLSPNHHKIDVFRHTLCIIISIYGDLSRIFPTFVCNENNHCKMETTKDINRIKVVLVEKKRTNKWLAEQLGKDPATVSKWCTNTAQPSLETLLEIARVLEVDVKDLLHSTREGIQYIKIQQP